LTLAGRITKFKKGIRYGGLPFLKMSEIKKKII